MLSPAILALGSPDALTESAVSCPHALGRYFHGLGDELDRQSPPTERRFRILITGSRDWADRALVAAAIDQVCAMLNGQDLPVVLVHGGCPTGADLIAAGIAYERE